MTYNTMAKRKIVIRSHNDLQYNGQKKNSKLTNNGRQSTETKD